MVECAPPLVCCELLPGTGLGSCAPSC
jgi:hypothetical protein